LAKNFDAEITLFFLPPPVSGLSFRKDQVLPQLCHGQLGPSNPELHMSVVANSAELGSWGGGVMAC